jgi:hypothetical protein
MQAVLLKFCAPSEPLSYCHKDILQHSLIDTQPLLLGRDTENGKPNSFLQGRIDEAAIYNRVLNPIEIEAIYLAGPAGKRL